MAGNVWEWTTENCATSGGRYLVYRGGCFGNSGLDIPTAYRNYNRDEAGFHIGFRVVLYK